LVIVVISLILLTESWTGNTWHVYVFISTICWCFYNCSCNLGRIFIISEEQFVLELPTSRAMLATARPRYFSVNVPNLTVMLKIRVKTRVLVKNVPPIH